VKEILNIIHKTIYQFFDACEKDAPMSDKDKLLLEVNKAICNNLKALVQPCEDCISREGTIKSIENMKRFQQDTDDICEMIQNLPSVTPSYNSIKTELISFEDCISRQAVIDTIETDCSWDIFNEWGSRTPTGECIINAIKSVPSVETERKTGKWIEGKKTPGYIKWNCSECGLLVRNPQKPWYEYCPKCGAPMEVDR
jgi:hypothetical protein